MEDGITLDLEANSNGDYIYYPGEVLKGKRMNKGWVIILNFNSYFLQDQSH